MSPGRILPRAGRTLLFVGVTLVLLLQMLPAVVVANHSPSHNNAPVIDPVADLTAAETDVIHVEVTASDPDGDSLTFEVVQKPAGATFQQNTSTQAYFKWVPTYDEAGSYLLKFRVRDEFAAPTEEFYINVTDVNRAPVLSIIRNDWIDELEDYSFNVKANDPDGDDLSYSLESVGNASLPAGVQFADGADNNAAFAWTPNCTQGLPYDPITGDGGMRYPFRMHVTDGALNHSRAFNITVYHVDTAPQLDPQDFRLGVEGTNLTFKITGAACDPEEHFLEVGLIGATQAGITPPALPDPLPNMLLPEGVTVEPEEDDKIWGRYVPVTHNITAIGSYHSASISANVTSGDAPLDVNFTFASGDATAATWNWTFDADGDNTTDSNGTGLPASANFTYTEAGLFNATLTLTSDNETSQVSLAIAVSNETVQVEPVLIFIPGYDEPMLEDGTNATYYSHFNWTIGYQQAGNYTFYAEMFDNQNNTDNISFVIKITDFNTGPVLDLFPPAHDGNGTFWAKEDTRFNMTSPLGFYVAEHPDPERQPVLKDQNQTLGFDYSTPEAANWTNGAKRFDCFVNNGEIAFNPANTSQSWQARVLRDSARVPCGDTLAFPARGYMEATNFTAVGNDTGALRTTVVYGEAPLEVPFWVTGSTGLSWSLDADGDGIADDSGFSFYPHLIRLNDFPASTSFTYTDVGVYNATLTVSNGVDTGVTILQIAVSNDTVVLEAIEELSPVATDPAQLIPEACTDGSYLTGNNLCEESGYWVCEYTPLAVVGGALTNVYEAHVPCDPQQNDLRVLKLPNRIQDIVVPVLNGTSMADVNYTKVTQFRLAEDIPYACWADPLNYTCEFTPLVYPTGFACSWADITHPMPCGTVFTVTADDAENDTLFWNLDWLEHDGKRALGDVLPAGMRFIAPGTNWTTGQSNNATKPLPAGDSFGIIRWVPDYTQAGSYTFRLWATDGAEYSERIFSINVENTNRRPTLEAPQTFFLLEGEELNVGLRGTDHDFLDVKKELQDDMAFTASSVPPGAQWQPGRDEQSTAFHGTFRWTPGFHQAGTYKVDLLANDADTDALFPANPLGTGDSVTGGTYLEAPTGAQRAPWTQDQDATEDHITEFASKTWLTIHVLNVDRAPVIEPLPEVVRYMAGANLNIPVRAYDVDGDPVTLSITGNPRAGNSTDDAAPLQATLSADVFEGSAPLAVNFEFTSSDDADAVAAYNWSFDGDGDGIEDSNGTGLPAGASFTYATAGTYTAALNVTNGTEEVQVTLDVTVAGGKVKIHAVEVVYGAINETSYPWLFIDSSVSSDDRRGHIFGAAEQAHGGVHTFRVEACSGFPEVCRNETMTVVIIVDTDFELFLPQSIFETSPDTEVVIPILVENTGPANPDVITFAVSTSQGTIVSHTQSVQVLRDGFAWANVTVKLPYGATNARLTIAATSTIDADFTKIAQAEVKIPVVVDIAMTSTTPSVSGIATVTFLDGTPLVATPVTATQSPSVNPFGQLSSSVSGFVDSTGAYSFSFGVADAKASAPGTHDLDVSVEYGGKVFTGKTTYTI